MYRFGSIKEAIQSLDQCKLLIDDMFEKRNSVPYTSEYAIDAIQTARPSSKATEVVERLIHQGILEQYDNCVRLGTPYMDFFTAILDVNEEISADSASQRILSLKENIKYYLTEDSADKKKAYARKIKTNLFDIGDDLSRNTSDLRRNIENVYKTEQNYAIKIAKLEGYREKNEIISDLSKHAHRIILNEEEITFFSTHGDLELASITRS